MVVKLVVRWSKKPMKGELIKPRAFNSSLAQTFGVIWRKRVWRLPLAFDCDETRLAETFGVNVLYESAF